jgi:outer membrane protein
MRYNFWMKFAAGAFLLLSASAAWAQGGAAAPALKIGLINVRGAIVATAEGKQASAQMQSQFAPQQAELENMQKQIQDLQTQLANGARTLSDEEKARLQRRGQLLVSQSQRKQDDLNESVNLAQTEIFESIGAKMSDVVDKFGKDNNYTVMLDMSAQGNPVIFNSTQLDVTEEIVRLYDQAHPVKGGVPASSGPAPTAPGQTVRPLTAAPAPGRGAASPGR